jgi:hypothetical protein
MALFRGDLQCGSHEASISLVVDFGPLLEQQLDDSAVALLRSCIKGGVTSSPSGIDISPVLEQMSD